MGESSSEAIFAWVALATLREQLSAYHSDSFNLYQRSGNAKTFNEDKAYSCWEISPGFLCSSITLFDVLPFGDVNSLLNNVPARLQRSFVSPSYSCRLALFEPPEYRQPFCRLTNTILTTDVDCFATFGYNSLRESRT
jgi:hypothetical protein